MHIPKTLIYFHGYGSDRQSRKFLNLQSAMKEVEMIAFEWTPDTNFKDYMNIAFTAVANTQEVIVVGDSAGANFAYQLREMRQTHGLKTILVLTSPLLNYTNQLRVPVPITDNLQNALVVIPQISDALLLLAKNDEVLDFSQYDIYNQPNTVVVYVDDNHQLERFEAYIGYIKAYIGEHNPH